MLFNSPGFLFAFLPVVYLLYRLTKRRNARYVLMTVAGYVFYGMWNYKFCFLMAFSTAVSYLAGLGLAASASDGRRRLLLVLPITIDLSLLAVFKYANFSVDLVNQAGSLLGSSPGLGHFGIILPVGISFYTFHTITYIVDSYRRTIVPTRNFFEFCCYVSLFTQLVAGPIVRFKEIRDDLAGIETSLDRAQPNVGWSFFCLGLAKKVLIADTLAAVINPALLRVHDLGTAEAWLCALGYTYQLYFDFSGYSDMAVGLGHLFGLRIPQNFNSPYQALDIADFWRRWHISLSRCLRDYVYIPLGGRDTPWRTGRNIMITMLLGGLWHGANWTFVIWGAYHGLLLVAYRTWSRPWDALPVFVRRAGTFGLVLVGWVLFRSDTLSMALEILGKMFWPVMGKGLPGLPVLVAMVAISTVIVLRAPNTFQLRHQWRWVPTVGIALVLLCCLLVMGAGQESPFLYFQF